MAKKDGVADAPSQKQSTSAEPEQAKTGQPEEVVEESGETQFFDGTVVKLDKDGNEVMSDHLAPGEKLRRPSTDRYTRSTSNAKAEYEPGK